MKILHYSLGFPPYRRGGLTKYCMDIMLSQIENGNSVGMIWPGRMKILSGKTQIKKCSPYFDKKTGINVESYEMINPLPVPLLEGIKDVEKFIRKIDISVFEDFLDEINPDVIHFHTVMGLPYEFLIAAKKREIRLIATAHDYFGICPKVTLIKKDGVCKDDNSCADCVVCNRKAMSIEKIHVLQSPLYRKIKESKLVKKMRKAHVESVEQSRLECEGTEPIVYASNIDGKCYQRLREYYIGIFESMDYIHFNSSLTSDIYAKYMDVSKGRIINISHRDISDRRKIKKLHSPIHITYLGPKTNNKGYFLLRKVVDALYAEDINGFELHIYFTDDNVTDYLKPHAPYDFSELEQVMDSTDVLIVPSVGYDTYGFTVLEALSYGVPVIVSNNAGAKDLIEDNVNGYIVEPEYKELYRCLKNVVENPNILETMNCNILKTTEICSLTRHVSDISDLYLSDYKIKK